MEAKRRIRLALAYPTAVIAVAGLIAAGLYLETKISSGQTADRIQAAEILKQLMAA